MSIESWVLSKFDEARERTYKGESGFLVNCPKCPERGKSEDTKRHLFINLTRGYAKCHRCEYGGTLRQLIQSIDGTAINDIQIIQPSISGWLTRLERQLTPPPEAKTEIIEIPNYKPLRRTGLRPHEEKAVAYLHGRNLPWSEIEARGIGTSTDPNLKGHVVFPIRNFQSDIVYYTGRRISSGEPRYVNPDIAESGIEKPANLLMNIERAVNYKTLCIVEGPFDIVLPNFGGILGHSMTSEQAILISQLWDSVLVGLDLDSPREIARTAGMLHKLGLDTKVVDWIGKDPNAMELGDVEACMKHAAPFGTAKCLELLFRGRPDPNLRHMVAESLRARGRGRG